MVGESTSTKKRKPWQRQPGETAKAYAAFVSYLNLGPNRKIAEAYRLREGCSEAPHPGGYFARWATSNNWVARAEAFDTHELEDKIAKREKTRERARQKLIDAVEELADIVIDVSRTGTNEDATRLRAARDALSLAGLDAPRESKIDIKANVSDPVRIFLPRNGREVNLPVEDEGKADEGDA